mgnify:CR=1 FL=1
MPDMMYLMSNLLAPLDNYNPYAIARFILLLVMLVASIVAIVIGHCPRRTRGSRGRVLHFADRRGCMTPIRDD